MAMQQLVEVRLHGVLATRFGRVHWLAIETAAEAFVALRSQLQGFAEVVRDWRGAGWRVRAGAGDSARWLDEGTLGLRLGEARRVDIVPALSGRKRNGWGQVILGAVVAIVGIFTAEYDGGYTTQAGIAMMLGGAVALLSPMPKGNDSKAKQEVNSQISGPANVISAGGPVPLIIGRMLVGSVTISAGLSTDAVTVQSTVPAPPPRPTDEPADWFDVPGGGDGSDA